jgi:hypothetical protein
MDVSAEGTLKDMVQSDQDLAALFEENVAVRSEQLDHEAVLFLLDLRGEIQATGFR